MSSRRVRPDAGEIHVQGQQESALCAAELEELGITRAGELFLNSGICFVPGFPQQQSELRRKILVNFEFQAFVSSGRSALPSRASSAA